MKASKIVRTWLGLILALSLVGAACDSGTPTDGTDVTIGTTPTTIVTTTTAAG